MHNGYSPAELLMSRKLRTTVPIIEQERVPKVPEQAVVKEMESQVNGGKQKSILITVTEQWSYQS